MQAPGEHRQQAERELKPQSDAIANVSYGTVLVLALGLLAMLAWGLHRVGTTAGRTRASALPDWMQDDHGDGNGNGSNGAYTPTPASNGCEELPEWARPPGRETTGSGAER